MRRRILALEEQISQQGQEIAAFRAEKSRVAQLSEELPPMQAYLARVTSQVRTTLPQLQTSSEAVQKQLSGEVERLQSEISRLQALAADHICLRDIEAIRQRAKTDIAALRSEIGQFKKAADAPQPPTYSRDAPEKRPSGLFCPQQVHPPVQPSFPSEPCGEAPSASNKHKQDHKQKQQVAEPNLPPSSATAKSAPPDEPPSASDEHKQDQEVSEPNLHPSSATVKSAAPDEPPSDWNRYKQAEPRLSASPRGDFARASTIWATRAT
jgi:hypothetical protein